MAKHIETGKEGEDIACGYLLKNGYKLIERNYREYYGEIDIIAINKGDSLVFVEVKTLKIIDIADVDNSAIKGITPEDNLNLSKMSKLKRIAEFYANSHYKLSKNGWQIDLIAIWIDDSKRCLLRHYKNVS